jgi:hypothetical protein
MQPLVESLSRRRLLRFQPERLQQLLRAEAHEAEFRRVLEALKTLLAIFHQLLGIGRRPAQEFAMLSGRRDHFADGLVERRLILFAAQPERKRQIAGAPMNSTSKPGVAAISSIFCTARASSIMAITITFASAES